MNNDMITDFRDLLAVERIKINESVRREIHDAASSAAARGMLQSSAAMQMVVRCAVATIPTFANTSFNLMLRAATAHGEKIGADNKNDIHLELTSVIDSEVNELKEEVRRSAPFKGTIADKFADKLLAGFDGKASLELDRLDGELRLIAAQNMRQTSGASSIININAPVGVVQTGPGSFGSATQHIDSGATEALHKALTLLIERLGEHDGSGVINVAEVHELAVEGKAELAKEKPNATKLKSLVQGIGNTIAYLPKFKDAYDTLKWAGIAIGVVLP